ncbi:alpha/beta hydrolase [Aquimarina sp. ERC-38]|uniref:alpha/beta hydrolase n=1 Tax=Aquimarina sp. ERC-38 TaxID=2949996 RepID=UPI002247AC73|nr:alpha/beta hydrolase [Aquimarina sp. ERC-38]UZO80512.1 alpha/beta hydrolase [Aquimarina sp. ERC-38]
MKPFFKKYLPPALGKYLEFLLVVKPEKAIKKAVYFFSTPKKGKVTPDQEFFLEEAEDDVVPFENLLLQTYRWKGEKETILLVHGWESNTHRWKILIEKLQQLRYDIVAFDAPAHGHSTGTFLNVPLYANCMERIITMYRPDYIIGHSIGAMTSVFYQYKFQNPEIKKMVLLAPPTKLETIMKNFQNILKLSDRFMTILDSYFKRTFDFYFIEFSLLRFANTMQLPGLLVHDKYDDIAPFSESSQLLEHWNKLQLMETENFGHSLYFDEVDDAIIKFIQMGTI